MPRRLPSSGRLVALFTLLACCGGLRPAAAQPFDDGFAFSLPPADSATVPFLPAFPAHPLTDADFISADGDAFVRGGAPIRFFGANLVADGAFPSPSRARAAAGRMRKMGFNLMRFHHVDNNWTRNLFADGGTRALDPEALDDLEYFVWRLKQEGIYVNMNLHVSRTFTESDGVPQADSIADYGKGVTFFDPHLVALQKEYARQLLHHVNPYTGRRLVDDPVLAMVEVTNENSLYFMWRNGHLKPYAGGGRLIARHAALLDTRWHAYLAARYASTDALRAAWDAGAAAAGAERLVDGGFEASAGGRWQLEQHTGTRASVVRDAAAPYEGAYAARVDVAQTGPESWNVQYKQVGLTIEADTTYTVSFALRAEAPRTISVAVQQERDPWTVYASFTADVTTEWKAFRFSFTAPVTSRGDIRLAFVVGAQTGSLWVDAVSMRCAGRTGLEAGESLEAGTVRRIDFAEAASASPARLADMTAFYVQIQDDYFAEMAAFLRDTLGVRVPITGTNWNFGLVDLAVQAQLDYVDNHAYWDHPQFPTAAWSSTDWRIDNVPMVRHDAGGVIARLVAGVPFAGKPFTVSEYNHPFPNAYQTEGPLFLAAYGAFHGLDGLMFFEYNGGPSWTDDRIDGFFSLHRNTAMMALMPSLARAFRDGLVAPAAQTLVARYARADVLRAPAAETGAWEGTLPFPRTLALRHGVVAGTYDNDGPTNVDAFPPAPAPPYTTDTGEVTWDPAGLLKVAAPQFAAATGFFDAFGGEAVGTATLRGGSGFGTFTWVSLTGEPLAAARRSLFTVSAAAQNTGMVWEGTTTVRDRWGRAPVVVRPLRLALDLAVRADSLRVYALDETGRAGAYVTYAPAAYGAFEVVLDQHATPAVWFGLEAFGDGAATSRDAAPPAGRFELLPLYPNPAGHTARAVFRLPAAGEVRLALYDPLGRRVRAEARYLPAGEHALDLDVGALSGGLYLCRLTYAGRTLGRPLVVL